MNSVLKEVTRFFRFNIFMFTLLFLLPYSSFAYNGEKRIIEAETAKCLDGASKLADPFASGKYSVSLAKAGQALTFTNLPVANKLAIRYASVNAGTVSVAVKMKKASKIKDLLAFDLV